MTIRRFAVWHRIHRWTSLVCTLVLLMLCATGIPLILQDEIGVWAGTTVEPPNLPDATGRASVDAMVADARARRPAEAIRYLSQDDDSPSWFVSMGKAANAADATVVYKYDARTGKMIHRIGAPSGFMYVIRELHVELFAGSPGTLFIGLMGLIFVASIVSGMVVYGPFMRQIEFGTVRMRRATRVKWLDLHNLFGIAIAAWLLVVGLTGVVNTLAVPLLSHWQRTDLVAMAAPWRALPPPSGLSSVQHAVDLARRQLPGMDVALIGYPGSRFSTSHHYLIFMRGDTPLTARLLQPVLVDAQTGSVVATVALPWYLKALLLAQPLHFGDYGGLPLKLIWIALDMTCIGVLLSGLWLWWKRRAAIAAHVAALRRSAGEGL